jgi:hypothetical protein
MPAPAVEQGQHSQAQREQDGQGQRVSDGDVPDQARVHRDATLDPVRFPISTVFGYPTEPRSAPDTDQAFPRR